MPGDTPALPPTDQPRAGTRDAAVASETVLPLNVPDLDARFRLKIRSMAGWFAPLMYDDFARRVDVAALRGRGLASVVSYVEFQTHDVPAAVAAPLHVGVTTRYAELSGTGPGNPASRFGFETDYTFATPPGTGDPLRYRETVSDAPKECGRARVIMTMVRPFAAKAERLVRERQPELDQLPLHTLDAPHPTAETLSEVDGEFAALGPDPLEARGVFGLHHTDINQSVFTGVYLTAMEDLTARHVAAAGLPAAAHTIDGAGMVFSRPFSAGDPYLLRSRLFAHGERTVSLVSVHALTENGPAARPSVLGRITGHC